MFPTPIHQRPVVNQYIYKIFLPISLIIWLIPIFGILMTSIRGLGDITAGNMWGTPSEFLLFSNLILLYHKLFHRLKSILMNPLLL